MHLVTILSFVILFWQAEVPGRWAPMGEEDVLWTLLVVLLQPPLLWALARLSARRAHRMLADQPDAPHAAQHFHHLTTFWLRIASLLGFAATVFLTRWPAWFSFRLPALQIFGDLIVWLPFVCGVVAVWLAAFPLEAALRGPVVNGLQADTAQTRPWHLRSYLDFNLRHHILVIAVPMMLILFAANMTRGYQRVLQTWSRWVWTPDLLLGAFAFCVFLIAPVLLIRIWHTKSLESGPVRTRLEAMCGRIGLQCRDILVWQSNGMMINAAVMGLIAPVRFVLLSDGLLALMEASQIEAVFGHEAGHIRHRHIQHFLVFAFVGWLLVVGLMELLATVTTTLQVAPAVSVLIVQGAGIATAGVIWGFGFGWLSRRFERQADVFGATSITLLQSDCLLPCSVHTDDRAVHTESGRVCATGAAIFASALDRVAVLNGIPREERSWRHSSIASRVRFLTSLAGDPNRGIRFERLIRCVKYTMLGAAVIGSGICVYYWSVVPEPAIMRLQAGGP